MNTQARIRASWKLPPAGLLLLSCFAWWLLLRIDWAAAAYWVRMFLVFYGSWMIDP